ILAGLGVRGCFSLVLGGDSLPQRKPHPLPIQHTVAVWQAQAARVAMIGDGVNDVRAGKAAGVCTVALTCGVGSRQALAAEAPDFLLDSAADLKRLLLPTT
ncbi:MAG TPA: HAD family hydrolase, partial [bacterium]|nr:HAD family hydrolase [bacterium]